MEGDIALRNLILQQILVTSSNGACKLPGIKNSIEIIGNIISYVELSEKPEEKATSEVQRPSLSK